MPEDFNRWLSVKRRNKGGEDTVIPVGNAEMIPHQTRSRPVTEYEEQLADTLEVIFAGGVEELPDIVAGLNESIVPPPSGASWTVEMFKDEMSRLATDTD
ncbi:MAG: hypothetical protein O3A84_00965 [Proteobacteria bacterium]|nr:hypothetical protein [Pseudomonadota bacterium]